VKSYLKTIYELASAINQNDALVSDSVTCSDMQKYYDFLDFLFESSALIRSITNRELPICNSLKAFFDNLIPRENKLLTFILNNEENIKEGQPVHYYDLYLRIIRENSRGFESKIEYIYVMIHRFKADQISARFIYEKQRVVEAIKSYSEIIHQYNRIVEAKRDKINKLDIEKRIARLLLVIGLPDEAALIYQKNHLVKSAEKCFKQILQEHHGDDKANKYMEFGKYLESEFSFAKAVDYYESAYEAAKTTGVRQECIKRKIECVLHSSNLREAEKRQFERYYQGTGSESEFLNSLAVEQGAKSQSQFSRLRNRLQWDENRQ
jgi:tetratricopeptide (TPR) repeat protein